MVAALQMIGTLAKYADLSWTAYGPSTHRGWFDDIILNSLQGATPRKGASASKTSTYTVKTLSPIITVEWKITLCKGKETNIPLNQDCGRKGSYEEGVLRVKACCLQPK